MVYLQDFKWSAPKHLQRQSAMLDWIAEAEGLFSDRDSDSIRKLMGRYGCNEDQIGQRYHEHPDLAEKDPSKRSMMARLDGQTPDLLERMKFFGEAAFGHFEKLYAEEETAPGQMVHVSCTGYQSPSAAQRLVLAKNWNESTEVLHAYHMGCYAAVPAIRAARDAAVRLEGQRVDVVHTEFCTLHFDPFKQTPEQWVIKSLFGDGVVKYSVSTEAGPGPSFEWVDAKEWLVAESEGDMTWVPGPQGFEMGLARDVPSKLKSVVPRLVDELLSSVGATGSKIHFAIHPGGPKILDGIGEILDLSEEKLRHSREALKRHGNLSSATLPMVWKNMLEDPEIADGDLVVGLAFGPGLTAAGQLLRKVVPVAGQSKVAPVAGESR